MTLTVNDHRAYAGDLIVDGRARFQVLTPTLVRMEYSPTGRFVDEPSVAVINRDRWPKAPISRTDRHGWTEIRTGKMTVRYKAGSGSFAAENLVVTWRDGEGEHSWRPGDKDDRNLGGTGELVCRLTLPSSTGFLSRNGWTLVDDSRCALWDKPTNWPKPRPENSSQDMYLFVYERDYSHMLRELTKLTGGPAMLPRYAFGTWFGSRAGYSADQWKMIVERFREDSLPMDIVMMDSTTVSKVIWAGFDWDRDQMPDPAEFFQWMGAHGVKGGAVAHYGPLTKENDSNFEAIRQAMELPKDTAGINHDFASRKYAELFMDLLIRPKMDQGLRVWFLDGCAAASMPGLDPMTWTLQVNSDWIERMTGKRAALHSRVGGLGSHRYATYYTGDMYSEWASNDIFVVNTYQAGNALFAYPNNTCGGVFGVDLTRDLYCRSVQFNSFSPMLWFHGLQGLRLPWEYGPEGIDTYRTFVGLRYRLLPYIYTYARMAHDTGMPLTRAMYLEYPDQESAYMHDHQYMFGRELLVAPITESTNAIEKPALKDTWLPAGDYWFDYLIGDIYDGGQTISEEYPLNRMPLFVRAGSILPMAPPMNYSDERPVDPLTFDVYAGKAAQFRLYEDDGISLDYRHNAFSWMPLTFRPTNSKGDYVVTIGPCEGQFKGRLKRRRYEIRLHGLLKPEVVRLDGRTLVERDPEETLEGWAWDRASSVTIIRLTKPAAADKKLTVSIRNAGTFGDVLALHKVVDYRERLRTAKREMKRQFAIALHERDFNAVPKMIRETEAVERALSQLVSNPKGIAGALPDLEAMTRRVFSTFANHPLECTRAIPDVEPGHLNTFKDLAAAQLDSRAIQRMTSSMLGLKLIARVVWDASKWPDLQVKAKLFYDKSAIGSSKVAFELIAPPEFGRATQTAAVDGYTEFNLRHPSAQPPARGIDPDNDPFAQEYIKYYYRQFDCMKARDVPISEQLPPVVRADTFTIRAELSWDGGGVGIARNADLEWR